MSNKNECMQGWRYFKCECGRHWKQSSRDHKSPSISDCDGCWAEIIPYKHEGDDTIPVDSSGNLINYKFIDLDDKGEEINK